MSKPYLSIIIPVAENTELDSMLSATKADFLLKEAMFDYEMLLITPEFDSVYESMQKFSSALHNAKCLKSPESNIKGLLQFGLVHSTGVLRAITFKNDFGFLKYFPNFIPLFKENEVVVGPKMNLLSANIFPQFVSAIMHSPYQFQIINEDAIPALSTNLRSKEWEFFTEAHLRLSLAGKKIGSVDLASLPMYYQLLDLHLFLDATTIRIHYLRILIRNIVWLFNKKIISVYDAIVSKYY